MNTTPPVIWSLACAGVTKSDVDWGVANLQRHRRSQDTDTLTFTAPGRAVDAAPIFDNAATVTVLRANIPWFVGRVTRVPSDGTADAENQSYELSGPWWYLEHLVFRQQWQTAGLTAAQLTTHAILGQALDGTLLNTGQVITEVLDYAIECTAPLVIGTVDPAIFAPLEEVKDMTCAEAVKHMLHWHPDCVVWFDYATGPHPTLHIRRRQNLPAANVAMGVPPFSSLRGITARQDLQPPSVVIHYEQTGSINGSPTFNIVTDAAPAGATGREFGAVCVTIPLRGDSSATTKQRIVTRGIIDSLSTYTSAQVCAYLLGKSGDIAARAADPAITLDGITITKISRALADPNAKVPDPSGATTVDPISGQAVPALIPAVYDPTLSNELVEGSITDWMRKNYAIRAQVHRLTFSWTADSGSGGTGGAALQTYQGTVDVTATNAGYGSILGTALYTALTSDNPGDAVPVGLAAAYLAGLSTLQYSGSVTLLEPEASSVAGLGQCLNITGAAQAAWATMGAMIVEESVDVDTGTTTITFGPPEHLGPQDLVTLLQVARPTAAIRMGANGPSAAGTASSATRTSGTPGSQNSTALGVTNPTTNACSVTQPATAVPTPFQFLQVAPGTANFVLNVNSYLRANIAASDNTGMTGSTTPIAFADGLLVWLQLDTSGSSGVFSEASIASGQSAPYDGSGDGGTNLINFGGGGTGPDDPFYWNESFAPLAQVFAADPSGQPVRGGVVYPIDTQQPPTRIEVVQLVNTHLALDAYVAGAQVGMIAVSAPGPLLS